MKIPLKYGLLTALGAIVWVLVVRNTISNPQSLVHTIGAPVFFNVLQFVMIYLGIKTVEREKGERPTFKEGLKTGVSISFVYGLVISLFFVVVLAVIGTKWLASEAGASDMPMSNLAARAFAALFLGTLIFGLIYSTVISFFLAKRAAN